MIEPYWQDGDLIIYHGDCLEIIPRLESVDLIVTDPPYPDYHQDKYGWQEGILDSLEMFDCRQFIFWSTKAKFPLSYTAIHIWDKAIGCASTYERIFERNGCETYKVFREMSVCGKVRAKIAKDIYTKHPSQKPLKLIKELIDKFSNKGDTILDPFLGSGTTLKACQELHRKGIGIEIEEKYVKVAIERLREKVLI